ncbi:MAG: hypothetical protein Q4P15_11295 [Propionibacteriaceae bacterium]|nr:hypothetical protein [Propionibacteriaceae bacterium]
MTSDGTTGHAAGGRRRGWSLGLTILLGVVAAAGLVWVLAYLGLFHTVTVADILAGETSIHPVEATAELCAEMSCVEGWQTDHGTYLRYEQTGNAEYWEIVLGDEGRRWNKIVLDMRGTHLTFDEKRSAIDTLFSYRDWS